MWQYGRSKLREIGPRGVFAGWSLSLVKDSFGYAAFFATFEYVKAQAYYSFVAKYYGDLQGNLLSPILTPTLDGTTKSGQQPPMDANPEGKISKNEQKRRLKEQEREEKKTGPIDVIKPHYAIEPTFLMLAGIAASITQQFVQHPLNLIQNIHYKSLAFLDSQAKIDQPKAAMLRSYYGAYKKTYDQCLVHARRSGGWRRWLYKGFLVNTIKQVPSTSAGLVIFELVRRRYGSEAEAVKIEKDGYDILLT